MLLHAQRVENGVQGFIGADGQVVIEINVGRVVYFRTGQKPRQLADGIADEPFVHIGIGTVGQQDITPKLSLGQ
jgi:hypothetical protein